MTYDRVRRVRPSRVFCGAFSVAFLEKELLT